MVHIIEGSKISDKEIMAFNSAWKTAFEKDIDILSSSDLNARDIHFFLHDKNSLVAIGRYRFITGILIGNIPYSKDVWGRADIGVCGTKGQGYGKKIISFMSDYALNNNMVSCIGFHGKKTTLSEFYRKCGLVVNETIGERFTKFVNGEQSNMGHTNVSHFKNDPFIESVLESKDKITIPFSW